MSRSPSENDSSSLLEKEKKEDDTVKEIPSNDTDLEANFPLKSLIEPSFLERVGKKLFALFMLTIFTSITNLLISYSKKQKNFSYSTFSVLALSETCKFSISAFLAYRDGLLTWDIIKKHTMTVDFFKFSLPSLMYFVQNNLAFYALLYLPPDAYIILNQLKVMTTGVLFWLVLKRKLTLLQWLALILLTLGTMTSSLSPKETEIFKVPLIGFLLSFCIVFLSALSGVTNEFLMKNVGGGMKDSIHLQNMKLYAFGTIFNLIPAINQSGVSIFHGINFLAILIILCVAFTGLIVSFVIKFADILIKTFATSLAMILTAFVSIWLFHSEPTITLFIGIIIICISLICYNYESQFLNK